MVKRIDWPFLFNDTRARVYLLWAVLTTIGFVATYYYQKQQINGVWFIISLIGLGYMYKVMPLHVKQMRNIFLAWLVPIVAGMAVSGVVFYQQTAAANTLIAYLGAFWLLVMAVGYFLNGLVDQPAGWYWFASAVNVLAAVACFTISGLVSVQYLVAAAVSLVSMGCLWLFRS